MEFKILKKHSENKYGHLLATLVLFLVFSPLIKSIETDFHLIALLFFFAIAFTLRALNLGRKIFFNCASIGVLALILGFISSFITGDTLKTNLAVISLLIFALFIIMSIVLMLKKMFSAAKVSGDVIMGGISLYLLIGYLWTLFYFIIYHFEKDAFHILGNWNDSYLFYFSFTTLTTLGYGDISPLNRAAMILANLESIVGQLYIAIFIARLVGLHIIHQSHNTTV